MTPLPVFSPFEMVKLLVPNLHISDTGSQAGQNIKGPLPGSVSLQLY